MDKEAPTLLSKYSASFETQATYTHKMGNLLTDLLNQDLAQDNQDLANCICPHQFLGYLP